MAQEGTGDRLRRGLRHVLGALALKTRSALTIFVRPLNPDERLHVDHVSRLQTSLVPLLKLFREWHLNTPHFGIGAFAFIGIWLAHTAFGLPLAVFLLRNFFITLPKDLIEAARMDGASNLAIFRRIVVPLSVPALASFAIFQFLWVWNDLLMALVFLAGQPDKAPMTVRIPYLLSTYGQEYNLLSAASFLLMIVPLIVFFSLQRYFVQGLLAGSVKT